MGKMAAKGKGKARVDKCRNLSGDSSDNEVPTAANYGSDGELVGEAIWRSPSFPPNLAGVVVASKTIEEPKYEQAFIKVGNIKYPEQVEVSSHVAFCLGRVFLIRYLIDPVVVKCMFSRGEFWNKTCVA